MGRRGPAKAVRDLGFRSKLEVIVNQQIKDSGISFSYEGPLNTIRYIIPAKEHRYVADFLLGNGIIIEAKGLFSVEDRKKHVFIKQQHPQLDIRLLFMNANNKLSKASRTTYGAWCDKNGIQWCNKVIPDSWLKERKPKAELQHIIDTLRSFQR